MNEKLIEDLKQAASNLSYYNAAEGDCYRQEAGARGNADTKFRKLCDDCREAGIDPREALKGGGYLVSVS